MRTPAQLAWLVDFEGSFYTSKRASSSFATRSYILRYEQMSSQVYAAPDLSAEKQGLLGDYVDVSEDVQQKSEATAAKSRHKDLSSFLRSRPRRWQRVQNSSRSRILKAFEAALNEFMMIDELEASKNLERKRPVKR